MISVAINGFGRIGRLMFRHLYQNPKIKIVAINDLADEEMLAYLLKHDTMHGPLKEDTFQWENGQLKVGNQQVTFYQESDPTRLPWKKHDVDIVLECTGKFRTKEKSQAHLQAGAKRVLISAPAGNDLKTIVYGVNHQILTGDDHIVSGASCTTNCLAPMAKALNEYRELRTGFMTTIHAYTGDQKLVDTPHQKGDFRRARAGAMNIVPNSTGAAKAIGLVIPELDGKLIGSAQRVPVATGSLTILDATLKDTSDSVSVQGINEAMKKATNESFGYNEELIVSSDVIGMSYGSLFDSTQTLAQQCGTHIYEVRVVAWYDNEMSYVAQLSRTLLHMAQLLTK